ncbi:MAG: pirin family protein [Opitutales bacterium]|nr:pirin family protein [Opitutales bacterium]MCH8541892.1 pirin family protein [Opitutales bacterium]
MKTVTRILRSTEPHWVGNGFPVQSIFDYHRAGRDLSPFLLLDYAAPHEFPPGRERRGVGTHPHKGFETVTIVYQGELEHGDSTGRGGVIGPGDVQWMTAGKGILHEEFHSEAFTQSGGTLEMVQLWVNLRAADKLSPPGYQSITAAQIPSVPTGETAGSLRVIAGNYNGAQGPAHTFTPMNVWDITMEADGPVKLPLPEGHSAALLVLRGDASWADHKQAKKGDLAVLSHNGDAVAWEASAASRYLLLSGEPIDEPIVGSGPFVMNTEAEIRQAHREFSRGLF